MSEAAVAGAVGGVVEVEGLALDHGVTTVVAELAVGLVEQRLTDGLVFSAVTAIGCAAHGSPRSGGDLGAQEWHAGHGARR